ncbi:MAG: phosphatidate cytidylyltransferase [Spirochaetaceae bacterium]
MKNTVKRVLLFFLATPALLAAILLFPEPQHLPFKLLVVVASGLAGMEVLAIFRASPVGSSGVRVVAFAAGAAPPAAATVAGFLAAEWIVFTVLVALPALVFAVGALSTPAGHFEALLPALAAYFFAMVYPGLFALHGVFIAGLPHASILLIVFLTSVFLNDSTAYVTGMLFGGRSRSVVAVSPNKSLAGFVGGSIASVVVIVVAGVVLPQAFPGTILLRILFGAVLGAATILGDLAESALKRSASVKDSGNLIPGRGGILDSADSPLYVAPVFYYLYLALFGG